jgi:GMP reductase|tara:strand:- start:277 stop:1320 length:1044 start_codon:yes stop_codon:yes gene_type:complete
MKILDDVKLDYSDVLIRPKRSILTSRKQVNLERTFRFRNHQEWIGIPIVAANMDTIGTLAMAREFSKHNMLTCLSKHIDNWKTDEQWKDSNIVPTFGMSELDEQSLLSDSGSLVTGEFMGCKDFICIDVANGYSQRFIDYIKMIRDKWPNKIIIAGNVVTAEMTEALYLAGADIVKVGIGPGSVCTTRKVAGVGYPQLSAVIECADAAHGLGGYIMADGGCTNPGDVSKAFGAGADFVMLGGMLAGHDECEGDIVTDEQGQSHKVFYGMSSTTAMEKYSGGVATYKASEGKTVKVPYRGPVCDTIQQILGGVRSACTYTGARVIKQLPKCTTFVRVNRQLNTVFGDA